MKLLFIATYAGNSGASHSLIALIMELRKKNISPYVIIPKDGPLEEQLINNDIPYRKIRMFNWVKEKNNKESLKDKLKWKLKSIINYIQEIRIYYIIKKLNIDITHINAVTASWGALASYKQDIPVVWHIREFLEEDLYKEFRNKNRSIKYLNRATIIVTISKSVRNKYQKILNNQIITKVYNGVDKNKFLNNKERTFDNQKLSITLVGRIVSTKGHEEVVDATKILIDKGYKNFKIRFIGDESNKEFKKKLIDKINYLELEDYINFEGYRADIQNVWSETDIALVSSSAEAFGRVSVEAMMAGALVIGADTMGTKEILNNEYGLLYKQGNPKSLADSITFALQNKNEIKKIANKGRKYASNNFNSEMNADNIYKVYDKIMGI